MRIPERPRVAVVGATGAVGRVLLDLLIERNFPASEVVAVASQRSEGRVLPFGDGDLTVTALSEGVFEGIDIAIMDTPDEVALEWAPIAVRAGAVVVDNSGAWRMDEKVPLVVPEINPGALLTHEGIIASPNCTTIGVVVPLWALHRAFGVERVVVSSYQATSGAGQPGVEELREQAEKLHGEFDALKVGAIEGLAPPPRMFADTIAFNVVPQIGSIAQQGYTGEEWKLLYESRKIMGLPDLDMTGTCVRVPTVAGHGSSVLAWFRDEVDVASATEALRAAPGVALADVPTPLLAAGKDACFVGRVRRHPSDAHALWFFTTSDNLRKGAALNALQIAESLLGR
ncbi:MAG TPA: aspartate-semialdehyde dehydrogenase [Actinomycetota bacterium]|nr:aspartate-semialdehyde dehydrogenase [Actinomycetota bacterium]